MKEADPKGGYSFVGLRIGPVYENFLFSLILFIIGKLKIKLGLQNETMTHVYVGEHDRSQKEVNEKVHKIKTVITHPGFRKRVFSDGKSWYINDIGKTFCYRSFLFSLTILRTCLQLLDLK